MQALSFRQCVHAAGHSILNTVEAFIGYCLPPFILTVFLQAYVAQYLWAKALQKQRSNSGYYATQAEMERFLSSMRMYLC